MVILLVLFTIVVDQDTAHTKVGDDGWVFFRELPENEVARIAQAEIARSMQTFANVATLADFALGSVFLLLCGADLAETNLDIGRELEGWSVEGSCFLLGQPRLVLHS